MKNSPLIIAIASNLMHIYIDIYYFIMIEGSDAMRGNFSRTIADFAKCDVSVFEGRLVTCL